MPLPLDLSGEVLHRCTLKSAWCPSQPERENRVLVRCAFPWQHTSENRLWCGAIWMWKYASFKSTDATSPRGEFAPGSALALTSWTDACQVLCWWVWDLELEVWKLRVHVHLHLRVSLYKQWGLVTLKNDFTSSLQRNIMLRVSSLSKLFY